MAEGMKKKGCSLRIGDLAAMFDLTPRTIRYYEELGLLRSDDRAEGLHRRYPEENMIQLKRIRALKSLGLNLAEIKEFFTLAEIDATGEKCRELLVAKYEAAMEVERRTIAAAQERLGELERNVGEALGMRNSFACPGEDCASCDFADFCGAAPREGEGT